MWKGRKFDRPRRSECPVFPGREGGGGRESHFAEEDAGKRSVTHKLIQQRPGPAELELRPETSNLALCVSRCF